MNRCAALVFACLLCTACERHETHRSTAPTSAAVPPTSAPKADPDRARQLAKEMLIVDGHVDLPYRLHKSRDAQTKALTEDPTVRTPKGDFDYERAVEGGLDAPFMSIYVPAEHQTKGGAKALADELIDMVDALIARAPDKFARGHNIADVRRAHREKRVALPMGIENGAALEGKLENVTHFHRRGIRYITLTHSKDNDICDSSYDKTRSHHGLSAFGRDVVKEMNRVGIMVDVSHISDDAFEQVIELSAVPVIASHSSCRHFTPGFERNMSDAMIKKLAARGGVIMINFGSSFIDDEVRAAHDKLHEAKKAFMEQNKLENDDPQVTEFVSRYRKEHHVRLSTVERVADHIDHVAKLVGVDHVGFGSDFDGVGDSLPTGLRDASHIPNLLRVLLERGYSEKDLEKICSANVLRVWEAVEKHAGAQKLASP